MQTKQQIIDLLNEVNKIDPQAMRLLMSYRVPCNENLANHPTVVVTKGNTVGILGVINGLFPDCRICAVMSDTGEKIHEFRVLDEKCNNAVCDKLDISESKPTNDFLSADVAKIDQRPPNGRWAPGSYTCTCTTCGRSFVGDKRAVTCINCAYKKTI